MGRRRRPKRQILLVRGVACLADSGKFGLGEVLHLIDEYGDADVQIASCHCQVDEVRVEGLTPGDDAPVSTNDVAEVAVEFCGVDAPLDPAQCVRGDSLESTVAHCLRGG